MTICAGEYQTITFVDETGDTPAIVAGIERARSDQSRQLGDYWGTPCVRFRPGGWTMAIVPSAKADCGDDGEAACHEARDSGGVVVPFAVVSTAPP